MKPRMQPPTQDDRQWQEARALLAADPAYAPWSDDQHAADAMRFDDWLDTMAGKAWLASEAEADEERRCLTPWEGW